MTDSPIQDGSFSRYRKYLRIDVALFIASMVGAFTLSGFAYLEKYYLVLDVPIERINISAQQFVAYGAAGLGSYIAALGFAVALVGTVTLLLVLFEKPRKKTEQPIALPLWVARIRNQAIEHSMAFKFVACLCMVALLMWCTWYLLVTIPSDTGRSAALKTATECTARALVYQNLDRYEGCQVAESDDMIYLLKRGHVDKFGVGFYTLELPKSGLKNIVGAEQYITYER
ncbi:hypothetical protein PMI21_04624 [Pseudomonas sp. GM18]|uniref:hypothetical protein n=1 Tax=Pseudomonas sp. GM18 TaxID=1144324 RepID=UPI00027271A0|nr:hypothetical protein [Pseudomonas sp. GM18]EJM12578.1 hypothetical protein PMI21_04624 [Pseudomonas sp. GM18]